MRNYTVMCMTYENRQMNFVQVPNVIANCEDAAKAKAILILANQGIRAEVAPDMGFAKAVIDNGPVF